MTELDRLNQELSAFIRSLYVEETKLLVFGEGKLQPRVMLVGEAPGEQETLLGRPFVGKAGKNLDEFLALSGIAREDVYISNVVKFRPCKMSAAGHIVNRAPTQEEIRLFLPYLTREIEIVRPECVVTLGNVPLRALAGKNETVGEAHGAFREALGRRLYPMYHPASVIYNPALREVYARDVTRLGRALGTCE